MFAAYAFLTLIVLVLLMIAVSGIQSDQ